MRLCSVPAYDQCSSVHWASLWCVVRLSCHAAKSVFGASVWSVGVSMFIIIIIINPLTARVVGAPQIILQPVFSIFLVLHCLLGLAELQACPFPNVVFPPLPLSALSSSPFHCALQYGFGQT